MASPSASGPQLNQQEKINCRQGSVIFQQKELRKIKDRTEGKKQTGTEQMSVICKEPKKKEKEIHSQIASLSSNRTD